MRTIADAPRPALPPPPPGTPTLGSAPTAPATPAQSSGPYRTVGGDGRHTQFCTAHTASLRHPWPPAPARRRTARLGLGSPGVPSQQTLTSALPSPQPPMPFTTAAAASARPLCCSRRSRRPPPASPPPPIAPPPAGGAGQGHCLRRPPPPPLLRPLRGPPSLFRH